MTASDFRKTLKTQLDKCDKGRTVTIVRNGSVYELRKVAQ